MSNGRHGKQDSRLPKSAHDRIARELRAYYQGLVNEPLPGKFQELLERLDRDEAARKPVSTSDKGSKAGDHE